MDNHQHNKPGHNHQDTENIKLAFFLNLSFTIIEIIGGFLTNSIAILSDALHDFGDSLSLGLSWYLENYSQKDADKNFSFGYARFSLLGALINSLVLIIGSFFIIIEAVPRLFNPEAVHAKGMMVLAIFGIVINGISVLKLRKGKSLNTKVVSWHLLEDVLGWTAVLIVSIVLLFKDLPILDPLLSIFIMIYVLYNVISNLKQVLNIFLQGVPKGFNIEKIQKKILEQTDCLSVHHTHIWSLEGEKVFLSTHVVVANDFDKTEFVDLKSKIKRLLTNEGIDHVTIEMEFENEDCEAEDCAVQLE